MEDFRKGDFVRLKDFTNWKTDRLIDKDLNAFKIVSIDNGNILISNCKDNISFADIEPIPINGKDDLYIYYDPITCASIVSPNDPAPIRNTDYTYFFESFKRCMYNNKNFQEIITDLGLRYVHEVQHFLDDKFHNKGLKINAV